MFRQGFPDIDLFVEQGTARVPNDGKFHVIYQGKIRASFRARARAITEYKRLIAEIGYTPPKPKPEDKSKIIAREAIERDLDRIAAYWDRAESYRTGGKLRNR